MLLREMSITIEQEAEGLRTLFDLGVELPIPPEMTRKVAGYIAVLSAAPVAQPASVSLEQAQEIHRRWYNTRSCTADTMRDVINTVLAKSPAEPVSDLIVLLAERTEGETRAIVEALSCRLGLGHASEIAAKKRPAE